MGRGHGLGDAAIAPEILGIHILFQYEAQHQSGHAVWHEPIRRFRKSIPNGLHRHAAGLTLEAFVDDVIHRIFDLYDRKISVFRLIPIICYFPGTGQSRFEVLIFIRNIISAGELFGDAAKSTCSQLMRAIHGIGQFVLVYAVMIGFVVPLDEELLQVVQIVLALPIGVFSGINHESATGNFSFPIFQDALGLFLLIQCLPLIFLRVIEAEG